MREVYDNYSSNELKVYINMYVHFFYSVVDDLARSGSINYDAPKKSEVSGRPRNCLACKHAALQLYYMLCLLY